MAPVNGEWEVPLADVVAAGAKLGKSIGGIVWPLVGDTYKGAAYPAHFNDRGRQVPWRASWAGMKERAAARAKETDASDAQWEAERDARKAEMKAKVDEAKRRKREERAAKKLQATSGGGGGTGGGQGPFDMDRRSPLRVHGMGDSPEELAQAQRWAVRLGASEVLLSATRDTQKGIDGLYRLPGAPSAVPMSMKSMMDTKRLGKAFVRRIMQNAEAVSSAGVAGAHLLGEVPFPSDQVAAFVRSGRLSGFPLSGVGALIFATNDGKLVMADASGVTIRP